MIESANVQGKNFNMTTESNSLKIPLMWSYTDVFSSMPRSCNAGLHWTERMSNMITEQKRHRVLHVELRDSALLTKQKDAVYKLHTLLIGCTRPKRNMSNAVTRRVLSHGECILWNGTIFFAKVESHAPLWLSKVQCCFLLKLFLFRIMYRSVKRNCICSSTEVSCNS